VSEAAAGSSKVAGTPNIWTMTQTQRSTRTIVQKTEAGRFPLGYLIGAIILRLGGPQQASVAPLGRVDEGRFVG
jgi:hypothetical protein